MMPVMASSLSPAVACQAEFPFLTFTQPERALTTLRSTPLLPALGVYDSRPGKVRALLCLCFRGKGPILDGRPVARGGRGRATVVDSKGDGYSEAVRA
jgi:hypothetical protein